MAPTELVGNEDGSKVSYRAQLEDQKSQTRHRILSAARQVFLRDGFLSANLNEVAEVADVGKGTLYRHFASKGEIYVAMLSQNGERFAAEMRGALDPHATTPEQLRQVARFYLDFFTQHPDHFQIVWAVQNRDLLGPLSPELVARVRRIFEAPLRMLEGLVRRGIAAGELRSVDPWSTANALGLSANAIVGPIVRGTPPVVERDLHAVYEQLLDLFIAGLVRDEARAVAAVS